MPPARPDPNRMTFLEHLEELRRRLVFMAVAIAIGFGIGWLLRAPVLDFLLEPVVACLPPGTKPVYTTLAEPFLLSMKVAFFTGLVLSFPVLLWQIWRFVAPGLYAHERRWALPFLVFGSLFFLLGCAFGYWIVFPASARFLIGFAGDRLTPMLSVGRLFGFETRLILALGLVFEMPVLIAILARIGLVTATWLLRHFKHAVVVISILAAVLTPTPDAPTMLMVALPMTLLYVLGIGVAALVGRPRLDPAADGDGTS